MPLSPYYKPVAPIDDYDDEDQQFGLELDIEPLPEMEERDMNQPQAETPIKDETGGVNQELMLKYMKDRYPDELANQSYEYEKNRVTSDEMQDASDSSALNSLMAAMNKSVAQVGNVQGKMADTSNIDTMAKDMNSQISGNLKNRQSMAQLNRQNMDSSIKNIGMLESKDPNSDYSRFTRQFAKDNLGYDAPPNVTAEQMEKFMPMVRDIYKQRTNAQMAEQKLAYDEQKTKEQREFELTKQGKELAAKKAIEAGKVLNKEPKSVEALNRDYVKQYNDFTNGGAANAKNSIDKLKIIQKQLEEDQGIGEAGGGRIASVLPDFMRDREAIRRRDDARNAANMTLKSLFGGQLSDGERKAASEEYFNDKLPNKDNAQILARKIKELEDKFSEELSKAQYFEQNGQSLDGFKGVTGAPPTNSTPPLANAPSVEPTKIPVWEPGK